MKGIKILFSLLFCFSLSFSQEIATEDSTEFKLLKPSKLKSFGKNAMKQGDYSAASRYFERYLKLRPDNYKVAFSLANSYRINRDYLSALGWYMKSFELSKNEHAPSLFYLAQMQKMTGDCKTSKENFLKFRKLASGNENLRDLSRLAKNEIAGCDSIKDKKSFLGKIEVNHLDTSINKIHIEGAPIYLDDSTVIYTSLRTSVRVFETQDSVSTHLRKFYTASKNGNSWRFSGEFQGPFNSEKENVSSGSFSPDGKRFYFSKCAKNWKGLVICALYVSVKEGNSWSEPEKLNKYINQADYSSSQPAVAFDPVKNLEVVYFVSNRKGGVGNNDIWYFTFNPKKKTYANPRNAGNKVNTTSDEFTPWYDNETKTLYFSSNGWPGIGGLDIFRSRGEYKKFTLPENLTTPINSSYDELYFSPSKGGETGLFSSNRPGTYTLSAGSCCDDLYEYTRLEFIKVDLKGWVSSGADSLNQKGLEKAIVNLYVIDEREPEPVLVKTIETDQNGEYKLPLEAGVFYKVGIEKKGYFNKSFTFDTKGITKNTTIEKKTPVTGLPEDVLRLDNVYYELDKHELTPASRIALDTTLVSMLTENPHLKIEIRSHTDALGSDAYNKNLSQRRAEGVVKYLISKGIAKERLVASGYGESLPIAPNQNPDGSDNPKGREKNRRTEFKVIGTIERTTIINEGEN